MPAVPTENLAIDVPDLLRRWGGVVDRQLDAVLDRAAEAPPRLIEAMRYSLLAGGKRLRPTLVLETCRTCQNGATSQPGPSVLAAAAAIELIHTFSLVHDDLPAMDDDDLRRGRPTNHKVFGEAMAILAGDAMVTMAFETLARDADVRHMGPLVRELTSASGPEGMIGGQVLDIQSEDKQLPLQELQQLHRRKTGALLTCACRMGAICADAPQEQLDALTSYGRHLGLAFQIVDDLLDLTATPEQLGKATKKDAARGKNTYPALLGVEGAQEAAQQQVTAAVASLEPFGHHAAALAALARFVVERQT